MFSAFSHSLFPKVIELFKVVPHALTLIGGLLFFVLRLMNKKIDGKVDVVQCGEKHKSIDKDLSRGREEFKDIRHDIKTLTLTQGETNTLLGQIKQQIEDHLKRNRSR